VKKETGAIIWQLILAAIFSAVGFVMWKTIVPVFRLSPDPHTRKMAEYAFLLGAFTGCWFGLAVASFGEFLRRLIEVYRKSPEVKSSARVTVLLLVCGLATVLSIEFTTPKRIYWWQPLVALGGICLGVLGIFRGIDRLFQLVSRKKRAQAPQQNSAEQNPDK
jgi:hypothetical protein